jgi:hypothetical protein
MATQKEPQPTQVGRIEQVSGKDGDVVELNILELEERVAPLWKRQYP